MTNAVIYTRVSTEEQKRAIRCKPNWNAAKRMLRIISMWC